MKIDWLVTDAIAVRSPDRAELAILGLMLGERLFICQFGPYLHLMKSEWVVTNVTAVRSPDRAERAILGVILAGRFLANSGRICGGCANL